MTDPPGAPAGAPESQAAAPGAGAAGAEGPGAGAVRCALEDWRRDGLLLCLLPVFCWPALVAAVLTRPVMLAVLLGPVVLGVRELRAVRRVRCVLRDPALRWVPYEAEVVRPRLRPPMVLVGRPPRRLTLGLLGRRALPPGPWPRTGPGPSPEVRTLLLAGDPAAGGVLWVPDAGRLGLVRPVSRRGTGRRPGPGGSG
ncbi:hypothetical protein AB0O18_09690 [Streptomyces sp. NPDC093224]|uniref:hypothetical protein n=1 Tax=Streptomyces sp. NPDC093224 TaxID=3155198 RepID=UPI00343A5F1B